VQFHRVFGWGRAGDDPGRSRCPPVECRSGRSREVDLNRAQHGSKPQLFRSVWR
jgi:hypothetical protein